MADKKAGLFQRLMSNPQVLAMAAQMANSMPAEQQSAMLNKFAQPSGIEGVDPIVPTSIEAALGDQGGVSAGQLGSLALGAAKAHPFKTAGLVGSAAGNIGGLTDNDKFGGQLAGLGIGGLGAYALAQGNPYMAAMMTMGGGNLGALFDKLRARKEMEQAQGIPNAGNPVAILGKR